MTYALVLYRPVNTVLLLSALTIINQTAGFASWCDAGGRASLGLACRICGRYWRHAGHVGGAMSLSLRPTIRNGADRERS